MVMAVAIASSHQCFVSLMLVGKNVPLEVKGHCAGTLDSGELGLLDLS
jgi:hypothetical protein